MLFWGFEVGCRKNNKAVSQIPIYLGQEYGELFFFSFLKIFIIFLSDFFNALWT